MGKILGIDLGTTKSAIAYQEGNSADIILTPEGQRLLPSIVAFTPKGERLVGHPAKSQMITNPLNTVFSVKTLMGKKFSEVEPYLDEFPYKIVRHGQDQLRIELNHQIFSPEEISAMILLKLKESAERHLRESIDGVVITVPAYFNDSQRQATRDAGTIAGLNVQRIINEPTAASIAYSIDLKRKANIVVYDFGGGTIDISVLEVQDGVIKVLATAGNTHLGGNNFDILLANRLIRDFRQRYQLDLGGDKAALQRIREAAENAKVELSAVEECEINLPFIVESADGPLHLTQSLSRSEFEKLIQTDVDRTLEICERALKGANLPLTKVDEVLLVGGTTRIPLVQRKVKEFFQKEPNRRLNPDEIVAMGAAMQGSVMKGESRDILLLDVTPLSLGVKTHGGVFTRIVNANTTIPVSRSLVFSTAEDNQREVEISIYQGEREIAEENKLLGKFTLVDIKPAARGVPRIEVTFSININGIVKVSAIDLSTKNKKEVVVSHSGLLTSEEIEKLKKEAARYSEQDQKQKNLILLKNRVVNFVYSIAALADKNPLPDELKGESDLLLEQARKAADGDNQPLLAELEPKLQSLENRINTQISGQPLRGRGDDPAPPAPPGRTPVAEVVVRREAPRKPAARKTEEPETKKEDTRPFKILN